jgi:RNA polymerase sigma-B factor
MNTFSDGMKRVLQRHPARSAAETRELGVAFNRAQERVCAVLAGLGYPLDRIVRELRAGHLPYFREGSDRDRKAGAARKAAYRFAGFTPSHADEFEREAAGWRNAGAPPEARARWQSDFLMRFTFDVIEQVALRAQPAPGEGSGPDGGGLPALEDALAEAHRLRGEILTGNLLLVAKIAIARSRRHRLSVMDDLFAAGTDGLMIAVGRYDPAVGLFSTYATPWIAMAIDRFVAKTVNVIRIPIGLQDKVRRERRDQDPREPPPAAPAIPEVRSLEEIVPGAGDGRLRLEDLIADSPATQPREVVERADISGILQERMEQLDDFKRLIIALRCDLGDAAAVGARIFREEAALSRQRGRAIAAAAMRAPEPPARLVLIGSGPEDEPAEPEIELAIAV